MAPGDDRMGNGLMIRESKLNGVLFLLALLVVWELIAQAELVNPLIVPPLSKIFISFWSLVSSGQIPLQILVSPKRAPVGYPLAAIAFIPLGVLMGSVDRGHRGLEVVAEMARPIARPDI